MEQILEIRPAEGGDDSRQFASDLLAAYRKLCDRVG